MPLPDGGSSRDRVRGLDGPAADLVAALAVWGGAAPVEHLAAVSGLPAGAMLRAVREATGAGVLVWRDDERLEFVHAADREAAAEDVPAPLRRLLLAAHAAALESADALSRAGTLAAAGRVDEAVRVARGELAATPDPAVRARVRSFLIFTLISAARLDDARAEIDAVIALPLPREQQERLTHLRTWVDLLAGDGPLPDPEPVAGNPTALLNAAMAAFLRGRTVRATELAVASVEARAGESWADAATATVWPAWCRLLAEGPRAADRDAREVRERAARAGHLWLGPYHDFVAARIHVIAGRWTDGVAAMDAGLAAAAGTGTGWTSLALAGRARVELDRGDLPAAAAVLDRAADVPEQFGLPAVTMTTALLDEARGLPEAALERAVGAWREARRGGRTAATALYGLDLARLATRAGRPDVLREMADALRAEPSDGVLFGPVAGLVGGLAGDDLAAVLAGADALAAAGDVPGEMAAREEAAALATRLGDADAARAAAARVREIAGPLGAEGVTRRLAARLRAGGVRLGAAGPRGRPAQGWHALTPTERRVAELVADGVAGPQMAVRLAISPRTVQTHVSNALRKLGLHTRVELAAAATRHRDT
ncbi:helix-turn-helix domain-containing protein [Actinomycetospora termitidis]|uniref:Helix-turn-helix transcriptional regulator n=1 Tax=Actinomycetospora termitidis TaxID=3053470 RepID=A0ABT7M9Z5_9PSEU|nr:helix-turn-helix transcriptional regulator [Actinomycetospora sp. Odt1-22]MDL5156647.1 helix-turn-helix transcriptional regulator [Actinomycetospora sp. Odt1-22]